MNNLSSAFSLKCVTPNKVNLFNEQLPVKMGVFQLNTRETRSNYEINSSSDIFVLFRISAYTSTLIGTTSGSRSGTFFTDDYRPPNNMTLSFHSGSKIIRG
jgi:hypothetical protein